MQNHLDTQSENVCLLLQEVRAEERSKQNKEKEEMEQKFAAEMEKAVRSNHCVKFNHFDSSTISNFFVSLCLSAE
jgi:hypothetical protein